MKLPVRSLSRGAGQSRYVGSLAGRQHWSPARDMQFSSRGYGIAAADRVLARSVRSAKEAEEKVEKQVRRGPKPPLMAKIKDLWGVAKAAPLPITLIQQPMKPALDCRRVLLTREQNDRRRRLNLINSSVQAGGTARASDIEAIQCHYNGRLRFG